MPEGAQPSLRSCGEKGDRGRQGTHRAAWRITACKSPNPTGSCPKMNPTIGGAQWPCRTRKQEVLTWRPSAPAPLGIGCAGSLRSFRPQPRDAQHRGRRHCCGSEFGPSLAARLVHCSAGAAAGGALSQRSSLGMLPPVAPGFQIHLPAPVFFKTDFLFFLLKRNMPGVLHAHSSVSHLACRD